MCGKITGTARIPMTVNIIKVNKLDLFSMMLSYFDMAYNGQKMNLNELVQLSNKPLFPDDLSMNGIFAKCTTLLIL